MDPIRLDRLLTASELSQQLGIPTRRIRRAIRSGDLRAVRIGEWWRVRERDAAAWLDRQTYREPVA